MAKQTTKAVEDQVEQTAESKDSILDGLLEKVNLTAPTSVSEIDRFNDPEFIAEKKDEAIAIALKELIRSISDKPFDKLDKILLDGLVADIDRKISKQLDVILHHEKFQELEATWRGLKFLVDRTDFRQKINIEILDASKEELTESFEDAPELVQSALYQHIYSDAYDQPGATPYAAMISSYEFMNKAPDVALLHNVAKVSAAAFCPFIGSVGPEFFGVESMEEWRTLPDLEAHLDTADFARWRSFRDSEDSRFVGLTLPRFLLRLPYGPDTMPIKAFNYVEAVKGAEHNKYLWGSAAFSMASNMVRSFMESGWCVGIRGPQAGGKVENLPVHLYETGRGKEMKIPTEVAIGETFEVNISNLGFIPFSHYEGADFACFFSANSAQKPKEYDEDSATANARINARLPYIFLASRVSHYLKVLQRENIGKTKDAPQIQEELNRWLKQYITKAQNPDEDTIAKFPLKDAKVTVSPIESNPGYFRTELLIKPHFQIEGMDVGLSLVGKIPTE